MSESYKILFVGFDRAKTKDLVSVAVAEAKLQGRTLDIAIIDELPEIPDFSSIEKRIMDLQRAHKFEYDEIDISRPKPKKKQMPYYHHRRKF